MRNNRFFAQLTRTAVASTFVAGCMTPETHSAAHDAPLVECGAAQSPFAQEPSDRSQVGDSVIITFHSSPAEWTKGMAREFRQLALAEAKGVATDEQMQRLEQLSRWRDSLDNPRPADEVLLQLKRDRLLEKISETLRQYVEFQQAAGKKRPTTA